MSYLGSCIETSRSPEARHTALMDALTVAVGTGTSWLRDDNVHDFQPSVPEANISLSCRNSVFSPSDSCSVSYLKPNANGRNTSAMSAFVPSTSIAFEMLHQGTYMLPTEQGFKAESFREPRLFRQDTESTDCVSEPSFQSSYESSSASRPGVSSEIVPESDFVRVDRCSADVPYACYIEGSNGGNKRRYGDAFESNVANNDSSCWTRTGAPLTVETNNLIVSVDDAERIAIPHRRRSASSLKHPVAALHSKTQRVQIFESIMEASQTLGVPRSNIQACLKRSHKIAKGYLFREVHDRSLFTNSADVPVQNYL